MVALELSEQTLGLVAEEGIDTPDDLMAIHYAAYQMAAAYGDRVKATEHINSALLYAHLIGDAAAVAVVKYTGLGGIRAA